MIRFLVRRKVPGFDDSQSANGLVCGASRLLSARQEIFTVTEEEWVACTDVEPMLEFLQERASDRMLRLFACACCRRVWHYLSDQLDKEVVSVAERFADKLATAEERAVAEEAAARAYQEIAHRAGAFSDVGDEPPPSDTKHRGLFAVQAVWQAVSEVVIARDVAFSTIHVMDAYASRRRTDVSQKEKDFQLVMCRDIFNNPFRPVTLSADSFTWNRGSIPGLAKAIYDDRAFDRLPSLASALEDAGCDNVEILSHCLGEGLHVRGCWVIDLLLGRGQRGNEEVLA
jgi:hypothetical protein